MKGSIIIIGFFILGILLSLLGYVPSFFTESNLSEYALYFLLFVVGASITADPNSFKVIKEAGPKILLVPVATIVGTALGMFVLSLLLTDFKLADLMSIGAGYGYYSLSSIYISEVRGETLGVIALLANILREIVTLLLTPLFARYFGKIAPIVSGGATSMDTTLGIITKYCGKEYALVSVVHGTILTILVPFIVSFFLKF